MEHILHRRDFLSAAKGKPVPMGGVLMQARNRADDNPPRIGFTCSKKIGNAVVRNRVRRRLREAARQVLPQRARCGHDYVLIGRASSAARDFEALKNDIISALTKLHSEPSDRSPKEPPAT